MKFLKSLTILSIIGFLATSVAGAGDDTYMGAYQSPTIETTHNISSTSSSYNGGNTSHLTGGDNSLTGGDNSLTGGDNSLVGGANTSHLTGGDNSLVGGANTNTLSADNGGVIIDTGGNKSFSLALSLPNFVANPANFCSTSKQRAFNAYLFAASWGDMSTPQKCIDFMMDRLTSQDSINMSNAYITNAANASKVNKIAAEHLIDIRKELLKDKNSKWTYNQMKNHNQRVTLARKIAPKMQMAVDTSKMILDNSPHMVDIQKRQADKKAKALEFFRNHSDDQTVINRYNNYMAIVKATRDMCAPRCSSDIIGSTTQLLMMAEDELMGAMAKLAVQAGKDQLVPVNRKPAKKANGLHAVNTDQSGRHVAYMPFAIAEDVFGGVANKGCGFSNKKAMVEYYEEDGISRTKYTCK